MNNLKAIKLDAHTVTLQGDDLGTAELSQSAAAWQQGRALALSLTAALSLVAAEHVRAATPEPEKVAAAMAPVTAGTKKPAKQCLADLRAFQAQTEKDGYWRGGSGYGYGYPMQGFDYGEIRPFMASGNPPVAAAYWRARPGFEIRTLLASAQIMAQRGQEQACAAQLAATRDIYGRYAGELRDGNVPRDNPRDWRHAQVAAAQPVTSTNESYRSDQLIGTEVLSPKGESLGSVDDMVLSPQTGKIAYLVIERGGLFGIDEKYVPVPWADFKATAGAKLLVLDTTEADMAAAPHIKDDRFSAKDDFAKQGQQVDAYWSAHPAQ